MSNPFDKKETALNNIRFQLKGPRWNEDSWDAPTFKWVIDGNDIHGEAWTNHPDDEGGGKKITAKSNINIVSKFLTTLIKASLADKEVEIETTNFKLNYETKNKVKQSVFFGGQDKNGLMYFGVKEPDKRPLKFFFKTDEWEHMLIDGEAASPSTMSKVSCECWCKNTLKVMLEELVHKHMSYEELTELRESRKRYMESKRASVSNNDQFKDEDVPF